MKETTTTTHDHAVDERGRCLHHPVFHVKAPAPVTHLNARYATATLVTDTISFDVVGATDKTVTVRRRRKTDAPAVKDTMCDVGAYGASVMHHETESVPGAEPKTYRMRKDGTFRLGDSYGVFRFTNEPPTERVDYRL